MAIDFNTDMYRSPLHPSFDMSLMAMDDRKTQYVGRKLAASRGKSWIDLKRGISVNEGRGPVNFTVLWAGFGAPFAYLYAFGRRWHS